MAEQDCESKIDQELAISVQTLRDFLEPNASRISVEMKTEKIRAPGVHAKTVIYTSSTGHVDVQGLYQVDYDSSDFDSTSPDNEEIFDTYEDEIREAGRTGFYEYGLEFTYIEPGEGECGYFRYLLSWGGPADEFRFYVDPGMRCFNVFYYYWDYNDHAKRQLRGNDKKFMVKLFDNEFKESGTAEAALENTLKR